MFSNRISNNALLLLKLLLLPLLLHTKARTKGENHDLKTQDLNDNPANDKTALALALANALVLVHAHAHL
jgi:hypothetical protein